jgi:hypothetical protein
VQGGEIRQEFRSGWRDQFYGSYDAGKTRVQNACFARGVAYWTANAATLGPMPSDMDLYQCDNCHQYYSHQGGVVKTHPRFQQLQLDAHHSPSVASHFMSTGMNSDQTTRETWNNGAGLIGVCKDCHQILHGAGHVVNVTSWAAGPDFKGPDGT